MKIYTVFYAIHSKWERHITVEAPEKLIQTQGSFTLPLHGCLTGQITQREMKWFISKSDRVELNNSKRKEGMDFTG